MYLLCRSTSATTVHVLDLVVTVLLVVPGKMFFLVTGWGAMESLDLLGKEVISLSLSFIVGVQQAWNKKALAYLS